ncbi:MAG: glycosyltransferase [Hymenobacter sp.]
MAYPNGNASAAVVAAAAAAGLRLGVTVEPGKNYLPFAENQVDMLQLQRFLLWGDRDVERQCALFRTDFHPKKPCARSGEGKAAASPLLTMKILWLAPYPHPLDARCPPRTLGGSLAGRLSQQPGLELTILNWSNKLPEPTDEFERNGIRFIYLKVPTVRHDILTLYQWRIAIVRAWLRRHAARYDLLHLHGSELQLPAMTAGLPQPQLLSVQGLVSQYPPFVPSWRSSRKILWTLAGYYERRYLPAVHHFICRTHWDQALVRQLSPGCVVHHNWEVLRPEFFCTAALPMPVG